MLYLLDTDTLTLLADGHPRVKHHVKQHSPTDLCISVISVEEQLTGWYSEIRRAKTKSDVAEAYLHLQHTTHFLGRINIMPYTEKAIDRWNDLRKAKLNVGSMDLKIAAIALEHQAVVVTRNLRDFKRVTGLELEDWSV
ncbi:MAG: type II toxin-antitoxin system VapC family toxin [Planctomycetia bacterium]|nr:type II toxin-antitoxin system VapC family toxin [Planctomycetia bacterium]